MIRLFRYLIFGDAHCHNWQFIKEIGNQFECRALLQCKICGKLKSKHTL